LEDTSPGGSGDGAVQQNPTLARPRRVDPEGRRHGRLEDLYKQHADGAGKLAYLLTGDRALAEDLVQEAFVRVARRLVHLRGHRGVPRLPAPNDREPGNVALSPAERGTDISDRVRRTPNGGGLGGGKRRGA